MDSNGTQRITLFEFVKGMRGILPRYRQAMVEFAFKYIDIKNDGFIDEEEVLNFYQNSYLPDILDGTTTSAAKITISVARRVMRKVAKRKKTTSLIKSQIMN